MKNQNLFAQIQNLSRIEKLEVMLFLASELAKEEGITDINDSELYLTKLRNSNEAAHQLMKLLEQEQEKQVQNA